MITKPRKLMIAGGGTGGHVWAGVAIIEAWKQRFGESVPVIYVGARGRIEEKIIPKENIRLELLSLGSLNHTSVFRKILTLIQLPWACIRSAHILIREKPKVIIGVGGYSSGPLVLMAALLSLVMDFRTAILEQNSVPGLTNRWLSKFVQKIFCAFPVSKKLLPSKKIETTGNPIRLVMTPLPPASRDPFQIFIFGGSQGAIGLNTLVLASLVDLLKMCQNLKFVHQTGNKDFQRVRDAYANLGVDAEVHEFFYDMKSIYSQSSLLICRAGASTLAEIAAINRAAILVPLPTAADNHQEKNAKVFVEAGAALIAKQNETSGPQLARMIGNLIEHPGKILTMERNIHQFYRPQAANEIVKQFEF